MIRALDLEDIPLGRALEIPGRGRTFIREMPGPPGAPVLLLLHGLGGTASLNWAGVFRLLGEHFRVIAIDHRGHGRGIRTTRFRLEDCADDVAALMDLFGIETGIHVGYSMSGSIAALLWRRHPTAPRAWS